MSAPPSDVEALKSQAEYFRNALEGITKRLAEIEGEKGE
jgi:hypothetical protein